jgi:hypothetical protein
MMSVLNVLTILTEPQLVNVSV